MYYKVFYFMHLFRYLLGVLLRRTMDLLIPFLISFACKCWQLSSFRLGFILFEALVLVGSSAWQGLSFAFSIFVT